MLPSLEKHEQQPPPAPQTRLYLRYVIAIFLTLVLATMGLWVLFSSRLADVERIREQLNDRQTEIFNLANTLDALQTSPTIPVIGIVVSTTPSANSNLPMTSMAESPCAWRWATQTLPELSATIQAEFTLSDGVNIAASALAFGEECLNLDGTVRDFSVMQTDFNVAIILNETSDDGTLGNLLSSILAVLANYPPENTPGPQPGKINFSFNHGTLRREIHTQYEEAIAAYHNGLTGALLLTTLGAAS